MHRLTATDTPMVRYTRTIFPSYATSEEEIRKCIPDLLEYLGMCSLASHVCLFELSNGFKKTYERTDSVPILAMTANAFGDDIERTKRWG